MSTDQKGARLGWKIFIWTILSLCSTGLYAQNATTQSKNPAPAPYRVIDRDANHRVWQRTTYETLPDGRIVPRLHKYTELGNGLAYRQNGRWVDAQEQIEVAPQGAVARQGRHQVIFANNLNSTGAIDQQTPEAKRLRSNILGLAYYDTASDQSVMIAQVKDSQGELIAANQVLYPNAFTGVKADVRYTYKKGGFEQDVILRAQPPNPEAYGLDPATTEIEVLTEFLNPPKARLRERALKQKGLPDQDIAWGSTRIGNGRAFDLGEPPNHPAIVQVRRQYVNVQGRTILIEGVPLTKIQNHLSRLPLQSSSRTHLPVYASRQRNLPQTPSAASRSQPLKLAANTPAAPGFVLDYVEINTDTNDFTFQGDTTYYITSSPNFSGHVIIEGGTVIKYTTDPANPVCLQFWGDVVCNTSPYHPAVITSQNDNSVGENLSNTNFPMAYYWGVVAGTASSSTVWHDLRICYAQYGIDATDLQARDCQFVNCLYPLMADLVPGATCSVTNVLIVNAQAAFLGTDFSAVAYHLTVDNCTNLVTDYYGDSGSMVALTNCLLVNVQGYSNATVTVGYTAEFSGDSSTVFQTVGGGAHYLATDSPYRQAGTLAVDDCVLDDISWRTTYPPMVYTVPGQPFTNSLSLYPQAVRDTNAAPDLGYHYAPLDYLIGGMYLTNGTITLNPGTALGIYGTNSQPQYGIAVNGHAQFVSLGAPNNLNHVTYYNTVQEQTGRNWAKLSEAMLMSWAGTNVQYHCQFTDWSLMANDSMLLWLDYFVPNGAPEAFRDCQFHGGQFETDYPTVCLTNCLFDRVYAAIYPSDTNLTIIRNNLFYGGTFDFAPIMTNSVIADNSFDQTVIPDEMTGTGTARF